MEVVMSGQIVRESECIFLQAKELCANEIVCVFFFIVVDLLCTVIMFSSFSNITNRFISLLPSPISTFYLPYNVFHF